MSAMFSVNEFLLGSIIVELVLLFPKVGYFFTYVPNLVSRVCITYRLYQVAFTQHICSYEGKWLTEKGKIKEKVS